MNLGARRIRCALIPTRSRERDIMVIVVKSKRGSIFRRGRFQLFWGFGILGFWFSLFKISKMDELVVGVYNC